MVPDLGFSTTGNATLVAYSNSVPILATDPWVGSEDHAYFGSWRGSHHIPKSLLDDIADCRYIWYSHGHPDHLNPLSFRRFTGNTILLPDHVGSRIASGLLDDGLNVRVIPSFQWIELADSIEIYCMPTFLQDAALLIRIGEHVVINLNDTGCRTIWQIVKREIARFNRRYFLCLGGYGDTDMINLVDSEGSRILPKAASKPDFFSNLVSMARSLGATHLIPFSSFHQFARADSIWAEPYNTSVEVYEKFCQEHNESGLECLPPFVSIDVHVDKPQRIFHQPVERKIIQPETFGDNYADQLTNQDIQKLTNYFKKIPLLEKNIGFIKFCVGGKEVTIDLNRRKKSGFRFHCPRNSLMTAIDYRIFDDLLIGNFMKLELINVNSLYDGFFNFNYLKSIF